MNVWWLRLIDDGDKAVVVFLGDPFVFEACFVEDRYKLYNEELGERGYRRVTRVAFNVALYSTKEVKVLELSSSFFQDVSCVHEKYGLKNWAFEIQRHGSVGDRRTTYSILPECQLSPGEREAFQALPLHDLDCLYTSKPGEENYDKRSPAGVSYEFIMQEPPARKSLGVPAVAYQPVVEEDEEEERPLCKRKHSAHVNSMMPLLSFSQRGEQRHRCAACAYEAGYKAGWHAAEEAFVETVTKATGRPKVP